MLLLQGDDEQGEVLKQHLDSCPECRHAREVMIAVDRSGAGERAVDMSARALDETRRRAARVIAEREQRAGPALRLPIGRRAGLAWAVSLLLLAAAGILHLADRFGADPRPVGPPESLVDGYVDDLHHRVSSELKGFRERFALEKRQSAFDVRAGVLRNKIGLYALQVRNELMIAGVVAEESGG